MVHGSPREPSTEYLVSPEAAVANFPLFDTPTCLVGHSHIPLMCYPDNGSAAFEKLRPGETVELGSRSLIINPGGLGQPRDRDAKAPYAIYDSVRSVLSHHRVVYDVARTQAKMADSGLPRYLRERLAYGL